jgi:large subunit ribosomal protein L10
MNKEQKQEVIDTLKNKFSQYSNFYITDTQNLSVAQVNNLRRHCFDKQVEMKVAKNTLIKKALESLDNDRYSGVYDSLHQVTALMFSESPKEPALIISSFRKSINGEKPLLKAAFLNGDVFVGDNQLINLTKIKTKNELIGEVIGLLMSPIQRVIGALQNRPETPEVLEAKAEVPKAKAEVVEPKVAVTGVAPEKVADTKSAVTEAKAEVAESKTTSAETKPGTPAVTETKAEASHPSPESSETGTKDSETQPEG